MWPNQRQTAFFVQCATVYVIIKIINKQNSDKSCDNKDFKSFFIIWDKAFKNAPSKIFWKSAFKKFDHSIYILKGCFHKLYFVHSWILFLIYTISSLYNVM